jgi:hypothetical protein
MGYIIPETKKAPKRILAQEPVDRLANDIAQLRKARQEVAEVMAFISTLELKIKAQLGDREEGTVNGVPVLRYQRSARVAWKQFCDDNPGLAKEYTIVKEVQALDEEALKAAHPALVEGYAVRNFTLL